MIDKNILIRRASFVVYFLLAFFLFLLLRFPFDQVKTKLENEVRLRTPVELSVARFSPRFFNRFVLSDVVISDKNGTVLFESPLVRTKVSILALLRGRMSVDLDAEAYGGELSVTARQGGARQSFTVNADALDIAFYTLLKNLGVKVSGKIGGNIEMTGDSGKGRAWFKTLALRELKVMGFPVPDLDFDQGWIEAELKGDRMTVRKFEADGKELKLRATGDVVLRQNGSLNLVVKLKPSERLIREQAALMSLLTNRDAEGFYQFTLGGTVSAPLPRL
ncbi:MAG: type II secretion system protein GspN [Nitrospirae bacterium GWC2_57_13]|jgi:type II secretion system protein N|nr:MAG: type II secretion system protein GspN [Nitrospirae bacterium GWC2_57_13]